MELCNKALEEDIARGDYKELVKLASIYLDTDKDSFKGLIKPGALHNARWMAKILFCIKIVLLHRQIKKLPKGKLLVVTQLNKIRKFVQFVVYCYIPWWLTAPVSSAAPGYDVNLIKQTEALVAAAARNALSGQIWYLTQELVPLSLFSSTTSNWQQLVDEMKKYELTDSQQRDNKVSTDFGKPCLPKIPTEQVSLTKFVGQDS